MIRHQIHRVRLSRFVSTLAGKEITFTADYVRRILQQSGWHTSETSSIPGLPKRLINHIQEDL